MNTGLLLPITFREFQVWHDSGELRVLRQRLLPVPLDAGGLPAPDPLRTRELMELIPHVDLEDEHTVLVAHLAAGSAAQIPEEADAPLSPVVAYLPFSHLRSLFPLTRRGKGLLQLRLSGYPVSLDEPVFEEAVQALWSDWARRRMLAGANALLHLMIARPAWRPDPAFAAAALAAMLARAGSPQAGPPDPGIWNRIIGYDRHKPIANTDLGFVLDLGIILKDASGATPDAPLPLNGLRSFCAAPKNASSPLSHLLGDVKLTRAIAELDRLLAPGLTLAAAPLFLKWKHFAQGVGGIDIPAMREEIQACAGRLPPDLLQAVVWLTGLFAGFSSFAAAYHARAAQPGGCIAPVIPHELVILSSAEPSPRPPRKPRTRKAPLPAPPVAVEPSKPEELNLLP